MPDMGYEQLINMITSCEAEPPDGLTPDQLDSWVQGYLECRKDVLEIIVECGKCHGAVKHGEWEMTEYGWRKCSVCGADAFPDDGSSGELLTPYCAWCGAEMDGERQG